MIAAEMPNTRNQFNQIHSLFSISLKMFDVTMMSLCHHPHHIPTCKFQPRENPDVNIFASKSRSKVVSDKRLKFGTFSSFQHVRKANREIDQASF